MNSKKTDKLSMLMHAKPIMAKTWNPDGTIGDYGKAKTFEYHEVEVSNIKELSDLLKKLEKNPRAFLIRGRREGEDPEVKRQGEVLRRKTMFVDQPLHAMMIDVEKWKGKADVMTPEAIEEFILTELPEAFHGISYHWQFSNSAGHPSKSEQLRAHIWFWLAKAATSAQLRAWSLAYPIDATLYDEVQIHYTAGPIGAPPMVRSGVVRGLLADEVDLELTPVEKMNKAKPRGSAVGEDPVVEKLEELGVVRGYSPNAVGIICPWSTDGDAEGDKHEPGGETSTVYLPATDEHHGVFKCSHTTCVAAHRTHSDIERELGLIGDMMPELPPLPKKKEVDETASLDINKKGQINVTLENVVKCMRTPALVGGTIAFDTFTGQIMLRNSPARPFLEEDFTRIQIRIERIHGPGSWTGGTSKFIKEAVALVAMENCFDSAADWLESLTWDGVPRVESFFRDIFSVEDTPYTRGVSKYMWTALAGRTLRPGEKADMVPVLVSGEGFSKSLAISQLVANPDAFGTLPIEPNSPETARRIRGKQVCELDELRGKHSVDNAALKGWITRTHEEIRDVYKMFYKKYARRCLFIGTTNEVSFLTSPTGNRRWLPMLVHKAKWDKFNRDQLWAEGAALWRAEGVHYQVENLAESERKAFEVEDVFDTIIDGWTDYPYILMKDLLEHNLANRTQPMAASKHFAALLRRRGYEPKELWLEVNGVKKNVKAWVLAPGGAREPVGAREKAK